MPRQKKRSFGISRPNFSTFLDRTKPLSQLMYEGEIELNKDIPKRTHIKLEPRKIKPCQECAGFVQEGLKNDIPFGKCSWNHRCFYE